MESSHSLQPDAREHTAYADTTPASSATQLPHEAAQHELDRNMEQLLTLASHELRTPLTSINGNLQLALRRLATGEQDSEHTVETLVELLGRAKRQLDRLNNLIEQILHAERIHDGRLDLRFTPCDLLDIIRDTTEQHRLLWPHRTITLAPSDIEHGDVALYVAADADHITQVITNYLSNALKFSRDETPVMLLVEQHGDQARIAVRDQGPGLPHDEHERVWERFYRARGVQELSGTNIGFGLGLYLCREIAGLHGGQVGVESAPGEGSTFWCSLPLLSASAQSPQHA